MKIAVFEAEPWERKAFENVSKQHDVKFTEDQLTDENADEFNNVEIISTFIYSDLHKSVLQKFENLRLIATRSTGFNHIDMDFCNEHGISVANVPSYGKNTVAEHAFGLLLTLSHNLYEAIDETRKGNFSLKGLRGFDLKGKTLGIIGTGDIGLSAIRIAKGFDMEVIAFDVKKKEEKAETLGFDYVEMDELLRRSDIISLHVPASPKTKGLLSREQFEKMKEGVVIINTCRGSVVNVDDLARALEEGKVAAAGLDVLPEEPVIREEAELLRSVYAKQHDLRSLLADHVLMRLRNVVVTPHSAFNTKEAVKRILQTTVKNIEAFINGKQKNVINEPEKQMA